jgi:hypothetical protein
MHIVFGPQETHTLAVTSFVIAVMEIAVHGEYLKPEILL